MPGVDDELEQGPASGEVAARHVGLRIRQRRLALGLSAAEVAAKTGVPEGVLMAHEAGLPVPVERLFSLAATLDVPASWFFGGEAPGPEHTPGRLTASDRPARRQPALQGLRVLLVEDDLGLASYLSTLLAARGCWVVGPAHDVETALNLLEREAPGIALLDAKLGKGVSDAVAQALKARGAPFLVLTGYESLVEEHAFLREAPRLRKPVDMATLLRAVEDLGR
jgi:transcriptional regulator with XRE-family HTH domain